MKLILVQRKVTSLPPFSDEDVPAGRPNVVDGAAVDAAHLNLLRAARTTTSVLSPDDDKRRDGDGHHRAPAGDVPLDGAVPFPFSTIPPPTVASQRVM